MLLVNPDRLQEGSPGCDAAEERRPVGQERAGPLDAMVPPAILRPTQSVTNSG